MTGEMRSSEMCRGEKNKALDLPFDSYPTVYPLHLTNILVFMKIRTRASWQTTPNPGISPFPIPISKSVASIVMKNKQKTSQK